MEPNRSYSRRRANGVSNLTIASAVVLGLAAPAAGQAQANDLKSPWEGRPGRTLLVSPPRDAHSSYVLGRDDEISVRVLESAEVSAENLRVGPDGHINLPLTNRIRVEGRTVRELEDALREKLSDYYYDPHVAVTIVEYRSQPLSVIGSVKNPGVHQLQGRKTLVEVLSLAGGLREDAGNLVKITRRLDRGRIPLPGAKDDASGQFSVAEINIDGVIEGTDPAMNTLVEPHDVISVPRAKMIYVVGEVQRAGGFILRQKESVSVLQAVALASGLTPAASKRGARILRPAEEGTERKEIAVNLKHIMAGMSPDVGLQPDDVLFIPRSGAKTAAGKAADTALRIATGVIIWRR